MILKVWRGSYDWQRTGTVTLIVDWDSNWDSKDRCWI
jgi:hypothetical protein